MKSSHQIFIETIHPNIGSLNTIAKDTASIIKNSAKCHKSVTHTKKVVDPKNLGP